MNRRKFLATCTGAAAVSSVMRPLAQASARLPIKKAVEFEMLPKGMSVADRLQMARDAGFADYFDVDVTLVRIIWLVLTIVPPGVGLIAYVLAWLVMPNDQDATATVSEHSTVTR